MRGSPGSETQPLKWLRVMASAKLPATSASVRMPPRCDPIEDRRNIFAEEDVSTSCATPS
jgi:hypothetical protein